VAAPLLRLLDAARAEIAELRVQIEELTVGLGQLSAAGGTALARAADLEQQLGAEKSHLALRETCSAWWEARAAAMEAALRKYGRHIEDCDRFGLSENKCICGLTVALAVRTVPANEPPR